MVALVAVAAIAVVVFLVRRDDTSTAFEATVNTQVRQDDNTQPLATGIVMGGANGTMGTFDGTLAFAPPSAPAGALVLLTRSAENGNIAEATVVRVKFS